MRAITKLSKDCADALEDWLKTPMHLVQPEQGKFKMFDIFGTAVCPSPSPPETYVGEGHRVRHGLY